MKELSAIDLTSTNRQPFASVNRSFTHLKTLEILLKTLPTLALTALFLVGCGGGEEVGNATCSDYSSQADAQEDYDDGETQLDGDGDGVACEHLP